MLYDKVSIFDGGMGSELERLGLPTTCPEDLNITNSKDIQGIHLSYKSADYITTNTFGLNKIKYHGAYSVKEIAIEAVKNARVTGKKVFFDIGPTGQILKPMGTLSFDDAYDAFKELVLYTKDIVDGYIVETFSDLYEIKACILAIKENSKLPIFATMTFDKTGRTLTGSTPEIVANTLTNLDVDALGVNCSLGPDELKDIVKRLANSTYKPIIIQPNRGLPKIKNGKTYYDMEASHYVEVMKEYLDMGVSIIGGCCGTNPEFIDGISIYKGLDVKKREYAPKTIINSATKLVEIDGVKICGERLNPTGKKKLKQALKDEDYDYLVGEALKQEENSDLLDLNCGLPGIDEVNVMRNAVTKIQEFVDLPLQIDSSNSEAIEAGCRYYNGIPLINSVNATKEIMEKVFPIVKKYGAVILGLALDDGGVPKTAEERFEKAKIIIDTAAKYGIPKNRVMIDTLVLTASAEQDLVKETLKALTLVRTLGVKTALGVSNVSFGLPFRSLLNKTFLSMAMYAGLNMPIINPSDTEMVNSVYAYNVLLGLDRNGEAFIDRFSSLEETKTELISKSDKEKKTESGTIDLYSAVKKGLKNMVPNLINQELEIKDPMDIINNVLIKALNDVGEAYDKGKMYLPQLISAAEAAKEAFGIISSKFPSSDEAKGTVVMCTVKGDVHDIGKNICKVVMESYGYKVIDLGKDTPIEDVCNAYKKYNPDVIGLSALMTTTVVSMEDTIKALRNIDCKAKIIVGGAVLTQDIADRIGADYYSKDALEMVNLLAKIIQK